jgi:hypothetical protein
MTREKVEAFGRYEEWEPRKVVEWILACRKDEGIPMFKSKFAGVHFQVEGKPAVMGVCWAGRDGVGMVMFKDVPESDVRLIEEGVGDWRKLIEKYGSREEIEKAESYGIFIKGFKLPRIIKT